jgi:LemA protein
MKKGLVVLIVILGVVFMIGGWFMSVNNKLITLEETAKASWAQVENQLQRRYDLIPNLVNTVKGYAAHESSVLTAVTEARARVGSAQSIPDKMKANGELTSAIGRLLVVTENYPNLKADQNFLALQAQLEGTENRISVERRRFNEMVNMYNIAIRRMPDSMIAQFKHMERMPLFESVEAAKNAPEVKF